MRTFFTTIQLYFLHSVPLANATDDDWDWDRPESTDRELGLSSTGIHEEKYADKDDDDLQMALALSMQDQTQGKTRVFRTFTFFSILLCSDMIDIISFYKVNRCPMSIHGMSPFHHLIIHQICKVQITAVSILCAFQVQRGPQNHTLLKLAMHYEFKRMSCRYRH